MRPASSLPLLLTAFLFVLPAVSDAQSGESNVSADNAPSGAGSVVQIRNMEPPSEAEKAEARRLARIEREKEEERMRQEQIRQCVIKPVMTDAEIAKCKEVWR